MKTNFVALPPVNGLLHRLPFDGCGQRSEEGFEGHRAQRERLSAPGLLSYFTSHSARGCCDFAYFRSGPASDALLIMTALELLRQTADGLAREIDTAGEEQLRRISSAIAHAVVERSGLTHPIITEALEHLTVSAQPHRDLQARVQLLAEQLDADYFQIQQPYREREDAGKAEPTVIAAFAKARAASAVAAALGSVARTAASEAAYEAIAEMSRR
jgi:hypothetical protein